MLNKQGRLGNKIQNSQSSILNYRINEGITADTVRLIDENGEAIGVVSLNEALSRARSVGLDLAEVSGSASPPVCKILDYAKEEYDAQKKQKKMKKNSKTVSLKEIRLTARIDDHDYEVKLKQARKFLQHDRDKVQVSIIFRGRELDYKDIVYRVVGKITKDLLDIGKIVSEPKLERKRMHMIFAPLDKVVKKDNIVNDNTVMKSHPLSE